MTNNRKQHAPGARRRKRGLDKKRCVVCGEPPVGFTGYVYYASGKSRLYAPFCKEHLDTTARYANPIFESPIAVDLFARKHPQQFSEDVKGKPLVFFTKIGYHALTVQ